MIDAAVQPYIATESALLPAVEEGKHDLLEGRTVGHAGVVAAFYIDLNSLGIVSITPGRT